MEFMFISFGNSSGLNLSSAHMIYDTFGILDNQTRLPIILDCFDAVANSFGLGLGEIESSYARGGQLKTELDSMFKLFGGYSTLFEDRVQQVLQSETSLDLSNKKIQFCKNGTAETMDLILNDMFSNSWGREYIAIPQPNWYFERRFSAVKDGVLESLPFDAYSPGELLSNFSKLIKNYGSSLKALVLAQPNVPLMYKLDPDIASEIDRIATKNGTLVLVDDVQRGVQPFGDRESIASYMPNAVLVEGTGKRFGENELYSSWWEHSYVVSPDHINLDFGTNDVMKMLFGLVHEALYENVEIPIIESYEVKQDAFIQGFNIYAPDIQVISPSKTHITSTIKLPYGVNAIDFENHLENSHDVNTAAIQHYCSGQVRRGYDNMLRVSFGWETPDKLFDAGKIIGRAIKRY